jgi:hypothetical protein
MMDIHQYLTLSYLYKILNSNAIAVGLVIISILFILNLNLVGLMVMMITVLAIPFSIYMMFVLYLFDKKGWIYGFLILMGVSFLPFLFFSNENFLLIFIKFAPLLTFVLYNMALKFKVGEWLMEINFEKERSNALHNEIKK